MFVTMDDALPELFYECGRCRTESRIPDGVNPEDYSWLHDRRCPAAHTSCPSCSAVVPVPSGMSPIEAIWLHEDECVAATEAAFAYA